MNKAESERLGSYLEQIGYQSVAAAEKANLIVLNSCVVRRSAERRVINKINSLRSLKRSYPDITLAVTGCLVGSEINQIKDELSCVDYFFKPGDYPRWLSEPESVDTLPQHPSFSTFVPIIQGCNNFCSYCIVPYRRGREKSRSIADVVGEVEELVRRGVKEVTLLGQNVDSYGHDLPGRPELADLLAELNGVPGLVRIRFLTNHPKDMSARLIEAVASLDKACEQISLPVQSGDDDILEAMKRGYHVESYRQLIGQIRRGIPGVALSTDVIVGFPSESREQFQHTVDLLTKLRFDTVHVAVYSPRSGTAAARQLEDNVPPIEKKERLNIIEGLQEDIVTEINADLLGKTVEVLVEGRKKGKWQGRTRSGKLVFFTDNGNYAGQTVRIRVEKSSPWALQGNVESNDTN